MITIENIKGKIGYIRDTIEACPEINIHNLDIDDVVELNNGMLEAYSDIEDLLIELSNMEDTV